MRFGLNKKLVRCETKCVYEETHPLAVDDAEIHAVLDVHVRLEQPPILRNSTSN